MIRKGYRLIPPALEWFLFKKRSKNMAKFRVKVSAREAHLNWLKRKAKKQ